MPSVLGSSVVGLGRPLAKPLIAGMGDVWQHATMGPLAQAAASLANPKAGFAPLGSREAPRLWHLSSDFRVQHSIMEPSEGSLKMIDYDTVLADVPPPMTSVMAEGTSPTGRRSTLPSELDARLAAILRSPLSDVMPEVEALCADEAVSETVPAPVSPAVQCVSATNTMETQTDFAQHDSHYETFGEVYDEHIRRLERRNQDLFADNVTLRKMAREAETNQEKTRELNLRMGKEVQQARREAARLLGRTTSLEEEVARLRSELKAAKRATKATAKAHSIHPQVEEVAVQTVMEEVAPVVEEPAMESVAVEACAASQTPSECSAVEEVSTNFSETDCSSPPPGLELEVSEVGDAEAEVVASPCDTTASPTSTSNCSCCNNLVWGCTEHNVYSPQLLLAHREISLRPVRAPPGLEDMVDLSVETSTLRAVPRPQLTEEDVKKAAQEKKAVQARQRRVKEAKKAQAKKEAELSMEAPLAFSELSSPRLEQAVA
eukprot:CAMPEP_0206468334 /NCGR_PEP_ID=MMETSP0324_2-20121206/29559_1 /ASSEMBLY_ACC=CAM_ASM_000836 /TAXON_ID=2866 /ORGANISM="Crypthecodinium cohnii, Strain Seligo" /LENGTH=489 /DNA_ID=CAMNT_0053941755 /DNA_START=229 /DNA_END=1698 /DNA_ORIENTATION=-